MTIIKSLHFNKEEGKDIRFHRIHNSKKSRNPGNFSDSEAIWKRKEKKRIEIETKRQIKFAIRNKEDYN